MENQNVNTRINIKQDIKQNKEKIIVLEAKKNKLNQQIEKLENKTNKNLIEKTKIQHLKHELRSRDNQIDNHHKSIQIANKELNDINDSNE